MPTRRAALLLAAAAALPRLAVLAFERRDILAAYVEKSDSFARTFVESGTYGLVPGEPSAYTQPLYGFFLVPIYWLFGHSWAAVGVAQTLLAVLTAFLVYALARRFLDGRASLVAALVATLQPYLVWHDVHVNREIVDQPLAVATVLGFVVLAQRPSLRVALLAGAAGGLAVLGNARLAGLPLVLALVAAWRAGWSRRTLALAGASLAAVVLAVSPWVVRNQVELGCAAITTDSRALWKANNPLTHGILARGGWIDEVPDIAGAPPTPSAAADVYARTGEVVHVDECAQMRYYRGLVTDFWREQPGEKARLSAQAAGMLWDPRTTATEDRPGQGTWLDVARRWPESIYAVLLYVFALAGLRIVARDYRWLAAAVLVYGTFAAMVFVGATRYRSPWDFVLAVLAAPALVQAWGYVRARAAR